jgi:hypothetical protein
MALHLLQFAVGGFHEFFVVFLMEKGLLVRGRLQLLPVLFVSQCFVGVLIFSCVLLFTSAAYYGRF